MVSRDFARQIGIVESMARRHYQAASSLSQGEGLYMMAAARGDEQAWRENEDRRVSVADELAEGIALVERALDPAQWQPCWRSPENEAHARERLEPWLRQLSGEPCGDI